MVDIRGIRYHSMKAETELLAEYAKECSIPGIGSFNPQWETYELLQDSGKMQMFAAYVDDKMVGFTAILCDVLPHYGVMAATVESLFVSEKHRGTGAGIRLMQIVERFAEFSDCKVVLYSAPAGGKLEAVLGGHYHRTNSVWCKPIGNATGNAAQDWSSARLAEIGRAN